MVDLYRVTANKRNIPQALEMCDQIKEKGYDVSLQLMGIAGYSSKDMADVIKPLVKSSVDYIYLLDSYGSLFPQDIKKFITWLKVTKKK